MNRIQHLWQPSLWAGVLVLALTACQSVHTTQAGAVGVGRSQMMMVSSQEMNEVSAKQYQQMLAEARKKNVLNKDRRQRQRVRTISNRLIQQTGTFRRDAPAWAWEVNVLKSEELNAWCMAGGKIAVYSGIIDKMSLTDEELAAILGHEIGHALREHSREAVSRELVKNIGVSVSSSLLGFGALGETMMGTAAKVAFSLPHSRMHEREADKIGVELAARAGYDPRAALSLWDKMSRQAKGAPPQWLSTHPSGEERRKELSKVVGRIMHLYQPR